eukprot:TRINITY_DN12848_c0_g4_i2.p3 TRINITY_DN12848_c0_g4~~TRINITY_DN12848_c0_g4_i2.p3  ORF type:complete len:245 (-),score=62.14 TRINITY_DN12848_c0_g4_i2:2735-3469(-)
MKHVAVNLQELTQTLIIATIKANDVLNLLSSPNKENVENLNKNLHYKETEKVILSCKDKVQKLDMIEQTFNRLEDNLSNPFLLCCIACKSYLPDKDLLFLIKEETKKSAAQKNLPLDQCLKARLQKAFYEKVEAKSTCIMCKMVIPKVYGDDKHKFCRKCWVKALSRSLKIPNTLINFKVWPIGCPIANCRAALSASYTFKSLEHSEVTEIFASASQRSQMASGTLSQFLNWHSSLILQSPSNS